jgi:hypothetical protein
MRVSCHRHAAIRERWMKELPMARSLTAQHPSLLLKPLQDLPNFHEPILPLRCERVNPQND